MSAMSRPARKRRFTVSAWPGRKFPAFIQRVGLGSTTTDNVVTYKTILQVDNDDLALRPGMTATATHHHRQPRRCAAGAQCRAALHAADGRHAGAKVAGWSARLIPGPPPTTKTRPVAAAGRRRRRSGCKGENGPLAVAVKTGVSNGRQTEVLAGDLKAGMAVITDYQEAKK